ncbi:hypothetical protein ACFU8I_01015 [Streptomyces sp. NPDC057540]|uniref:hypothetical protein n=1 Tax=Streptomyces sp. NPDC057540 TaxID=3346160 RepID=UPI0036A24C45
MSGGYPKALDLRRVVKGEKIASGGQGTVWTVEDRTINGSWPVTYKEYHSDVRPRVDPRVLADLVAFVPSQERGTGLWLAECTAWPAGLVTTSGEVCGFLMRRIPQRFTRTFAFDPDKEKAAGFEYLLNDDGYLRTAGIMITPRQRFQLLLDLAGILARLHELGIVVGDISPKNMYFTLDGTPGCFLIDCDAMVLHGRSMLPQVETPDWNVPEGEPKGTRASDAYKLGLLAARLFAGRQEGRDVGVLSATDPAVGQLAALSLSTDPALRPTPAQWLTALESAVVTAPTSLPQSTGGTTPPQQSPTHQHRQPWNVPPPPTAHRSPRMPRPMPPQPPATSHKGRWLVAIVGLVLALNYGPSLVATIAEGSRSSSSHPSEPGSPSDDAGASTTDSQVEQARALSDLLERNKGNRSSVGDAVRSMTTCPGDSGLVSAKKVFEDAASARDSLLKDLVGLESDLLPGSLASDLESGWQASATADRAYARLAEEMMDGCTPEAVLASSQWEEASSANTQATQAKKDFATGWNSLAEEHGLSTVSWDEV